MIDDEMKIYINELVQSNGIYTRTPPYGGPYTVGGFDSLRQNFRRGRRRPLPKYLDPTPYELLKKDISNPRGRWTQRESNNGTTWAETRTSGVNHVSYLDVAYSGLRFGIESEVSHDSNLRDISRLKALAKLNDKNIDLGTAFREWGKTAQLLGDVAHLSVDLLRAAHRRDARGFIRRLTGNPDVSHRLPAGQNVVDTYLAYHYGVKPSLQDVSGAVQALSRIPPQEWRVRAKGASSYERKKSTGILADQCYLDGSSRLRQSCKTVVSCTRKEISRQQDILWALGLDDPLSTAWEITPWSFVIDWALPIGDWLAAINASKYYTDWQVVSTSYTKVEAKLKGSSASAQDAWGYRYAWSSVVSGAWNMLRITREIQNTLPMTTLPVKNPASLDHMAKGLSLLATTLARSGEPPRFLRY